MANRFDYVKYDDESCEIQAEFKDLFIKIENYAEKKLGHSRWKSELMTQLEYAYACTGKAIRDQQIKRNADTVLHENRNNE